MCSNNTGGEHCDLCAEGYYGDPSMDYGCQSCPCPETQRNFARGCTFQNGHVSCICKLGYVGSFCDKCAKGFYGLPEQADVGCIDCDCDPNGSLSNECDEISGACNCKIGVAGRRCDKCDEAKSILQDGDCKSNVFDFIYFKIS